MIDVDLGPFVLASASPRRRELLESAGYRIRVVEAFVDESTPPDLSPEGVAEELALQKARLVARRIGLGTVIGGDTVVALGSRILGKPMSDEHAREMLLLLSGKTHRVVSGVAVVHAQSGIHVSGYDVTKVTMRSIATSEIDAYVRSGEGADKAGGYAIQANAARFVLALEGEKDTVIGFPMRLFEKLIVELGCQVKAGLDPTRPTISPPGPS